MVDDIRICVGLLLGHVVNPVVVFGIEVKIKITIFPTVHIQPSATLRWWIFLVAVVVLVFAEPVGVAPVSVAVVSFDLVVLDTREDTAEDSTEEPVTEDKEAAIRINGVAFAVLSGVACRSKMLISKARLSVAASRMEMPPIYPLAIMLEQETKEERKPEERKKKSKGGKKNPETPTNFHQTKPVSLCSFFPEHQLSLESALSLSSAAVAPEAEARSLFFSPKSSPAPPDPISKRQF